MNTPPISCYIIASNEADRIPRALQSVKTLAQEVVVVINPESSDNTLDIAKKFGAQTFIHPWKGYGPQKQFAEDQCKNQWLLNLDADEWLSPKLAEEIRALFLKGEPPLPVWRTPIKNTIIGEDEPRKLQRSWHKNSLYNKSRFRMTDRLIHEGVNAPSQYVGKLKNPIFHKHARSITHFFDKHILYAERTALYPKSPAALRRRIFTEFPLIFLRQGALFWEFLFGTKGFTQVMLFSFGRFIRIAVMLEKHLQWEGTKTPAPRAPVKKRQKEKTLLPISCFLITHNEADRIGRALESVYGLCGEILLVDSGSTDDTISIAESFGARVIHRDWPNSFGNQKRFAQSQCQYDYVLNLDADEWVSPEMAESIREVFKNPKIQDTAWETPRYDVFPGNSKPWRFLKGWALIRLYDKRHVGFSERYVGDPGVGAVPQKTKRLRGKLLHAPIRSLAHLMHKENIYSSDEASIEKNIIALSVRIFTEFPLQFLKIYFLRRMCFGGTQGFVMAMIYSFARFLRIAKKLERQKKWAQAS